MFPHLPERTRLFRLLVQFEPLYQHFLAEPTFFGVADSYGIELVYPWREKRTQRAVACKGLSNHRWIVGAKLAVVTNNQGTYCLLEVVGANVHDTAFRPLIENQKQMIVSADSGFKAKEENPANLKICKRGSGMKEWWWKPYGHFEDEKTHSPPSGTAQSASGLHLRGFQSLHILEWRCQTGTGSLCSLTKPAPLVM